MMQLLQLVIYKIYFSGIINNIYNPNSGLVIVLGGLGNDVYTFKLDNMMCFLLELFKDRPVL